LTIIPIYLLVKTFFRKEIALLGATLFLFDPRIIQNSILGGTDSLFILFTILAILFIFYKKSSLIYLSFIFVALAAFVRYEGIVLIIPLLVSYAIKNRQQKIPNIKLLVGISLFLIIIIPINFINYEDTQQTSIFTQIVHRGDFISGTIIENKPDINDEFFATNENHTIIFIENAVGGFFKYLGWILIPTSIIFCVLGIIFMPKKITKNKIIFGLFFVFLALSSIYAYGRGFQETRYLLVLLPIITLFSGYGLNYLLKINLKHIQIIIIFAVILSSFVFIEYKNQDSKYELEMYEATVFLTNIAQGVNDYSGNKFVKVANLQNNWPELLDKGENGKMELVTKKFGINGFEEPEKYIKLNKDQGLTHLLIKEGDHNGFFDDVFHNENKYPLLEKIVDSKDLGIKTKYKIFKINNEE
jgi:4-amino-4-deoxy-L-arabinose transferase-like glycosyltransferase